MCIVTHKDLLSSVILTLSYHCPIHAEPEEDVLGWEGHLFQTWNRQKIPSMAASEEAPLERSLGEALGEPL